MLPHKALTKLYENAPWDMRVGGDDLLHTKVGFKYMKYVRYVARPHGQYIHLLKTCKVCQPQPRVEPDGRGEGNE